MSAADGTRRRSIGTFVAVAGATFGTLLLRSCFVDEPASKPASSSVPASLPVPKGGVRTITGTPSRNRYGSVQVAVVLDGGRITEVRLVHVDDPEQRSQEINDEALPRLPAQVLAAQSADIDGVSGATYTSTSYAASVQSALDQR